MPWLSPILSDVRRALAAPFAYSDDATTKINAVLMLARKAKRRASTTSKRARDLGASCRVLQKATGHA
jgi:hypothetical protein